MLVVSYRTFVVLPSPSVYISPLTLSQLLRAAYTYLALLMSVTTRHCGSFLESVISSRTVKPD